MPPSSPDPRTDGVVAYPRWRLAPPHIAYELLLPQNMPLAEIGLTGDAAESYWLIGEDGNGVCTEIGASGNESDGILRQVPEDILAVLDQIDFSAPSSAVEFTASADPPR